MSVFTTDTNAFFNQMQPYYENLKLETEEIGTKELEETKADIESAKVAAATPQKSNTILFVVVGFVFVGLATVLVLKKKKII